MTKTLSQILSKALLGLVAITAVLAAIFCYIIIYYSKDLPDYKQLAAYEPPVVTRLYSSDGKLIEEYAVEHRVFVPINAIPKLLIHAFLAAEDKNFYQHQGVDIGSIMRAVWQNIGKLGQNRSLVGGSTITQQVVKNFLLTNEKSFSRKIKEAILSLRISKAYSKDRILELYLNQIYLGSGSYGVVSASLNYFNKYIDKLTVEEAAFIAAMPKAPSNYDPKKYYDKAKARRDWVIERMQEEGFITAEEAQAAIKQPINLSRRDVADRVKAPFFAEEIRKDIAAKYGSKPLYENGFFIQTTLDSHMQPLAEQALRHGLANYDHKKGFRGPLAHLDKLDNWQKFLTDMETEQQLALPWRLAVVLALKNDKAILGLSDGSANGVLPVKELLWAKSKVAKPADVLKLGDIIVVEEKKLNKQTWFALQQIPQVNGGMVVIDPHTGRILAMVGGFSFEKSKFNRVTQASRQPGSEFKTFVYMAALESGFTPTMIINDAPIEMEQGPGLPMWRPKNYTGDFLGPITLRVGLEKSRNTITVRLAQMLGIKKISEIAKRFGIIDNPPVNYSLVLGSAETTLLRMTNAYAIIANGGKRVTPYMIERIQDRNGKLIYRHDSRECQGCTIAENTMMTNLVPPELANTKESITDERTAYQMISILQGVIKRGTGQGARKLNRTVAGKTGTTNDSKDVWFIGFTPDLVVGTYMGYDQPVTLGARETGASGALPMFVEFMSEALKEVPDKPFTMPNGINLVKINVNTGESANGAGQDIIEEVFKSGTEPMVNNHIADDINSLPVEELDILRDLPADENENQRTWGTGGIY